MTELRQRPGDQQLPVHVAGAPVMHDLVADDIRDSRSASPMLARMAREFLMARKALGVERYGTPLQAHNGRDALRDAKEELADALVYLRQWLEENSELRTGRQGILTAYHNTREAFLSVLTAEAVTSMHAIARAESSGNPA